MFLDPTKKSIPKNLDECIAPNNTATIHNSYDTMKVMKMEHMQKDIDFIAKFVDAMANAKYCPVSRDIPEKMKEELDYYLTRKRKPNKQEKVW